MPELLSTPSDFSVLGNPTIAIRRVSPCAGYFGIRSRVAPGNRQTAPRNGRAKTVRGHLLFRVRALDAFASYRAHWGALRVTDHNRSVHFVLHINRCMVRLRRSGARKCFT